MPPMNLSLRPATAGDSNRVAELLISTRRQFMPYAPLAHTEAEIHDWVARSLLAEGGVIVPEVDGRVVGAMATKKEDTASWIIQVAVDPDVTGRG